MRHSIDALAAFAQVADAGSFSAAARHMKKGQSSVSEAIANLEIDLNVQLFDRTQRPPRLTPAGASLLTHARQVLAAHARLDRLAREFSAGLEPRLTLALSDVYEWEGFETVLHTIDKRFPDIEFECMVAESHDIVSEVRSGRAHIGLLAAQTHYPADIVSQRVPESSQMGLYVASSHPLAGLSPVTQADLAGVRELRLNTFTLHETQDPPAGHVSIGAFESGAAIEPGQGARWSAPNYLMLLEMAVLGFGWAALPAWMVQRYAADKLHPLAVAGWPTSLRIDAIWHGERALGAAGAWLLARVLGPPGTPGSPGAGAGASP